MRRDRDDEERRYNEPGASDDEADHYRHYEEDYDEHTGLLRSANQALNSSSSSTSLQHGANGDINSRGITWYFAVFLIVNAALGAGLLNFAKAFDNAGGILISTIIHLALVVVIVGALIILAFCTDNKQSANFQDVVYGMCGKKWQTINSICIIFYMFGCCITFFIVIGDQLDQIITCIFGADSLDHWYFNRKLTITLSSTLFILPLCYPKRIDFLTYPSTFAVFAIVYVVILIPIKYATSDVKDVVVKTKPDEWMDVFTVLPVICFGYQCHVNAVPIYACLRRKSLPEFTKSIIVSILIVFSAYTITATFGYLTFGEKINDDLLKSYDSKDGWVLAAVVMYLLKTYTSYPLNLFCARTAIEGLWIEALRLDSQQIVNNEPRRRVAIVTVWFVLSLAIALFIPNITVVIHYLGALAATFMFIFPGLCLLLLVLDSGESSVLESINSSEMYRRKSRLLLLVAVFYITLGTFIIGLVVAQSLQKDFNFK